MRRAVFAICFLALLAGLVAARPAHAGGPSLQVGITDDGLRGKTLVEAKANLGLARALGVGSIRLSTAWWIGMDEVTDRELGILGNTAKAARLIGMPIYLSVYPVGSRQTPLTEEDRAQFAGFTASIARRVPYIRDYIIGNEPNLNGFWMPQFNEDGTDAAAPAYGELLAKTYDALKSVSPKIRVIGGAVSPRGADNPEGTRPTHSPTTFIRDLGSAYRLSGRTEPIMDQFAIHPYQDSSRQSPATRHNATKTISIADYPKLVRLLGEAFDGTAQPGSTMPIVYSEYGIESSPPQAKGRKYTGSEPTTTRPVAAAVQAAYYRLAMQIAFCQPTVRLLSLFLLSDEPNRGRWQSGLYYVDKTPKPSAKAITRAAGEVRRGVLARCPGLRLPVKASVNFGGPTKLAKARPLSFKMRCNIDCSYVARVERLPNAKAVLVTRGRAIGRVRRTIRFQDRALPAGRYRVRVTLVAPVNPGAPSTRSSPAFQAVKPRPRGTPPIPTTARTRHLP